MALRIASESLRWTRSGRLGGVAGGAEVAHQLGGGHRRREAEAVEVHLGQPVQERLAVARGAQLDAHAARPGLRAGELAVRHADRHGHALALPQQVLAAVDDEPHRALDHLVGLGLLRMDVGLGDEAARAADHVELDELPAGVLTGLPDLDDDAQPGHLECGHGAYALLVADRISGRSRA